MQLDQNIESKDSKTPLIGNEILAKTMTTDGFAKKFIENPFPGGFHIEYVKDAKGIPLKYTVNQTMMRIDLDKPLNRVRKYRFLLNGGIML